MGVTGVTYVVRLGRNTRSLSARDETSSHYDLDEERISGTGHNPRQQSGQGHIREIYNAVEKLRGEGNGVNLIWLPSNSELEIQKIAKTSARPSCKGAVRHAA